MTNEEFKKLGIFDKVKAIMDQPYSEMECRDMALSHLERYYDDFGFDDMESQVEQMASAYEYIAEESGIDYGGVEMQNHIKSQAIGLRDMAKKIRRESENYRKEMMEILGYFKDDLNNILENPSDGEYESTENPELNESIEKIKSNFKRFL